ncbi:hypothetical protein SAMN04488494_1586 [Xylanibacter ruminicola]|uniref:Nuclease-related domain-containing protein n=1 Tax=Xylanibacter ruminicola TaxID=839 RepID=A0A1M7HI59_XYLRU|nr:hypothetical protein [Xylanibacter ruminicola]SHM28139.1 hypothetical protein SAMN04488494_1586 [Xylanibacter ruminicola]
MSNVENSNTVLDKINARTKELQELLSTINRKTAIPVFLILGYASLMSSYKFDHLVSRVKQIAYVIRLLLNSDGHCEICNEEVDAITDILNEIQKLYWNIHDDGSELKKDTLTSSQKKILVAQSCYASNYYNTELLYQEQEIDRIRSIFSPFDKIIVENEGCSVEQLIIFYIETNKLIFEKADIGINMLLHSNQPIQHSISFIGEDLSNFYLSMSLYEKFLISAQDYKMTEKSLAEKLLKKFSLSVEGLLNEEKPIYYCQNDNPLLKRPLIELCDGKYMLLYNIQLITAIYHYLENVSYIKQESLSRSKKNAIENKTYKLFSTIDKSGMLFKNYAIEPHGKEKDLLFIAQDIALIIECKSNKQIEYSRNTDKAYETISRHYNVSIQKAYEQALEVATALHEGGKIDIFEKDSDKKINSFEASSIKETHIIIVSQERYSLIQNNPSLLLHSNSNLMPTCFCIDDLETILLTLCRFRNPLKEFCEYLIIKEQISSRILSYDELDFAAKFICEKDIIKECLGDNHIYRPEGNESDFFDILYNEFNIGFDNELPILGKHVITENGLQVFKIGKRIGMNFTSEEESACMFFIQNNHQETMEEPS